MSHKVMISLGSNKGDRLDYLARASQLIEQKIGNIISKSPVYESESWGYKDENYLNAVLCLTTSMQPQDLLEGLLEIEITLGRQRELDASTYSARTIDLDIVLIEDLYLNYPNLTVPHPRMHRRKFVLQPLVDIAPDWHHEKLNLSMTDLLAECEDLSTIKQFVTSDF